MATVEVLVVAGGGGGGMDMGGGGGGGGVIHELTHPVVNGPYYVTVGGGGAGAPAAVGNHEHTKPAKNGEDSIFDTLHAIGGGYGGSSVYTHQLQGWPGNGGSGGGRSGYSNDGTVRAGGTGTAGQGYNGGQGGPQYYSGGGGGAGGAGTNSTGKANGGPGYLCSILGTAYYWGGGGGGAGYTIEGGDGGIGGGGGGAVGTTVGGAGYNNGQPGGGGPTVAWANTPGGDAGANTGGGGGGGAHYNANNKGGDGGSGIVIISYATDGSDGISPASTGGTKSVVGPNTVHTFLSDGVFTVVEVTKEGGSHSLDEAAAQANAEAGIPVNQGMFTLKQASKLATQGNWDFGRSLYDLAMRVPDGDSVLKGTNGDINIEAYTFSDGNLLSTPTDIGSATPDERMCILRYPNGLHVNSGVLLQPQTRKRGMAIFVEGDCTVDGTISMTARGAIAPGQRIHVIGSHHIAAYGGKGAKAQVSLGNITTHYIGNGLTGEAGAGNACGGGGGGGMARYDVGSANGNHYAGAGARGTSFSGGGGGGSHSNNNWGTEGTDYYSGSAQPDGGAGGRSWQNWNAPASGGAGNPGGAGGLYESPSGEKKLDTPGESGTGGLLILFVTGTLTVNGTIEAKGSNAVLGANAQIGAYTPTGTSGGGGSGGGSVNIFYGTAYVDNGTVSVAGGLGGTWVSYISSSYYAPGGNGGAGSLTIAQI